MHTPVRLRVQGRASSSRWPGVAPFLAALLLAVGCGLAVLAPMPAYAQWRVVDEKGNQHLGELSKRIGPGDVNARLRQLHDQQRLAKPGSTEHAGEAAPPELALDALQPSQGVEIGVEQRCPPSAGSRNARALQRILCEEMVRTELARYRYSLRMYEVALVRSKRLAEIERERAAIGEDQQGRLQDNSNKLLALLSRMQVDRQQHQTYMDAYGARLQYLSASRDTLAVQAMEGDRSHVGTVASIATLGALALALEAVRTERRDWREHRR